VGRKLSTSLAGLREETAIRCYTEMLLILRRISHLTLRDIAHAKLRLWVGKTKDLEKGHCALDTVTVGLYSGLSRVYATLRRCGPTHMICWSLNVTIFHPNVHSPSSIPPSTCTSSQNRCFDLSLRLYNLKKPCIPIILLSRSVLKH